jgi:hypothetical protein
VKLILGDKNARAPLQWRFWRTSYVYWPPNPEGTGPGEHVYASSALLQEDAVSAAAYILQASTSAGVALTDSHKARKRLPKLLAVVPELPAPVELSDSDCPSSSSDDSDDFDNVDFARVVRTRASISGWDNDCDSGGGAPGGESGSGAVADADSDDYQPVEAEDDSFCAEVGLIND